MQPRPATPHAPEPAARTAAPAAEPDHQSISNLLEISKIQSRHYLQAPTPQRTWPPLDTYSTYWYKRQVTLELFTMMLRRGTHNSASADDHA